MNVNITYPPIKRGSFLRRRLLRILRWPFILAAIACVVVNVCIGGVVWSPIAIVGLFAVWKMVLSPDLVDYNRTSQFIKTVVYILILLAMIELLIVPGWAAFVIPIVGFTGVAIGGVLFFTDMETQKHNMLPLVLFLVFAIIGSTIGLTLWHEKNFWPFIVLDSVSVLLLLALIIVLGGDFLRELKRRFHIK